MNIPKKTPEKHIHTNEYKRHTEQTEQAAAYTARKENPENGKTETKQGKQGQKPVFGFEIKALNGLAVPL